MGPFKGNLPKSPIILTPTPGAFWTSTAVPRVGRQGLGSREDKGAASGHSGWLGLSQSQTSLLLPAGSRALGSLQSTMCPDRLSLGARNCLMLLHQEPPNLGQVPRAPRSLTCPCCHTAAGSREAAAHAPLEPQTETWGPRSPQLQSQRPWLSLQGSTTQNSSCKRKHPG